MFLIATVLIYALYVVIIVILVRVLFSWLSPYPTNSVSRFAYQVTEPILAPVRRWLPPVSGMDLSPLVVTLVAYFVIAALRNLG
ncbi:MAG TPA: YggT family protein [Clostridia bacterium]|nr:YggT family protein [Clostridia bacterium]